MAARVASPLSCLCLALFLVHLWLPFATPCGLEEKSLSSMLVRFKQRMTLHGRQYNDVQEREQHFSIFKKNIKFINSVNAEEQPYKVRANSLQTSTKMNSRLHTWPSMLMHVP
ncbi:hypothetical protein AMTR_s00055p00192650 [Amborella trichopoda]|uniref:Cathepsin propeptide inhibitor domain-containing protein n=1 Tax=Amborella trichopoda TaxID=13333 RepID=U5DA80_AMBTC|nr:hypothetical protein AMTR_s00055p00192650 [Amborella trichopoda]